MNAIHLLLTAVAVLVVSMYPLQLTAAKAVVAYSSGKEHYIAKCASCHGASGEGIGIFPALQGKGIKEITSKMERYRASKPVGKLSPIMYLHSSSLTDEQIEKLSQHIYSLGQ